MVCFVIYWPLPDRTSYSLPPSAEVTVAQNHLLLRSVFRITRSPAMISGQDFGPPAVGPILIIICPALRYPGATAYRANKREGCKGTREARTGIQPGPHRRGQSPWNCVCPSLERRQH
jgi:hypothetical protein